MSADVSRRRDCLRGPQRSEHHRHAPGARRPALRAAGRARDAPANDLPRQGAQPQFGDGLMAYWEPIRELDEAPLVQPGISMREVTEDISRVTENRAPIGWWLCFLLAVTFVGVFTVSVGYLFYRGVGV